MHRRVCDCQVLVIRAAGLGPRSLPFSTLQKTASGQSPPRPAPSPPCQILIFYKTLPMDTWLCTETSQVPRHM